MRECDPLDFDYRPLSALALVAAASSGVGLSAGFWTGLLAFSAFGITLGLVAELQIRKYALNGSTAVVLAIALGGGMLAIIPPLQGFLWVARSLPADTRGTLPARDLNDISFDRTRPWLAFLPSEIRQHSIQHGQTNWLADSPVPQNGVGEF